MGSFRSKPVGWRNESYRHYLAAKYGSAGNRYFTVRSRLRVDLLRKLTPEQREEAKRLLASGELKTTKDVADRFGLEYEEYGGSSARASPRTEEQKLKILKEIGREKGRMPKTGDLGEYGLSTSAFMNLGGFGVALKKVVDEEADAAIGRGKTIMDLEREKPWWWESKARKIRAKEELLTDKYATEEMKKEREQREVAQRENMEKIKKLRSEHMEKVRSAEKNAEEKKQYAEEMEGYLEDLHEQFVGRTALNREWLRNEIQRVEKQLKEARSEAKLAQEELQRVKESKYLSGKYMPMRPVETEKVPEGREWLAERKWDGTRMRVDVEDNHVRLTNRRQNEKTSQFPEFQKIAKDVRGNIVFDGEVIVPWGKSGESFRLLSVREHTKDRKRISELSGETPAQYIAFDVLGKSGKNTMMLPFVERKRILKTSIRQSPRIREVSTTKRTKEFTRKMKGIGAEGVVFKDENSLYMPGKKSNAWRKLKFKKENDVVVTGYTLGVGKRKGMIGALKISAGGKDRGKVGTGFDELENKRLKRLLDAGRKPVIRVEYRGLGSKGAYREPVYVGLRSDIRARQTHG